MRLRLQPRDRKFIDHPPAEPALGMRTMRRPTDDPCPDRGAVRQVSTADAPDAVAYSPDIDGRADPGEVVWAWVPYEDDPLRGKDRPLLVVGRHADTLRALMLSSRTPDDDRRDDWLELGSGAWDRDGRVSFIRLDRLFELGERDIRREGSVLAADQFQLVADALRARYGWS
jgi:hypothetical protein